MQPIARILAAFALVAASACASPTEQVAYRLADYVDTAALWSAPGQMIPSDRDTVDGIGTGWEASQQGATGRVTRRNVEIHFSAPGGADLALTLDIRAAIGTLDLSLDLNGVTLNRIEVSPRWTEHTITLPAGGLRTGRNMLNLTFTAAREPRSESAAAAELVARVRELTIGTPALPPKVTIADGPSGSPAGGLVLPAGSTYEVLIDVPESSRLVGSIEPGDGPVDATIAISTSPAAAGVGDRVELWSGDAQAGSAIDLDLSRWANQLVSLRFHTEGAAKASAVWKDLRVVAEAAAIPASARPFPELATAPASGRLGRPDVFIVLVDAARTDAFSPYGASRATPAVAALANDGTVFTNAYSGAPWTGQGLASLLTGRDPEAHGVATFGQQLPETIPLIQEIVADLGYHTALWAQHAVYSSNRSLRRGFDVHVRVPLPELAGEESGFHGFPVPSAETLFIEEAPSFALLHYLAPHMPYAPPPPHHGMYSAWGDGRYKVDGAELNSFRPDSSSTMTEEHLRFIRDRYDENVSYVDSLVGRFTDLLKASGRYDDALIIFTSDHGEAFLEHGFFLHTRLLYEEVMRVPLIVKWPAGTPDYATQVDAPVSTIQLAATIADLLGIAAPEARFQGRSLVDAVFTGESSFPPLYYSSSGQARPDGRPRPMTAMRVGALKIHHYVRENLTELYDLSHDPGENNDLSAERPTLTAYLLQQMRLREAMSGRLRALSGQVSDDVEIDEATLRELRALGYIQ